MSTILKSDEFNPGTEGLAILRKVTRPEWLRQPEASLEFFRMHGSKPIIWHPAYAGQHAYDCNGFYLAAAAGLMLGCGEPVLHEKVRSDARGRAGIWEVELLEERDLPLPPIMRQYQWIYSPTLRLLEEQHYRYRIGRAYLFPEQHECLRSFQEEIKAMREIDKERAKKIYTKTLALLAHRQEHPSKRYFWHPDWYYSVVAEAAARLYRKMFKVWELEHKAPLAVMTDCIHYAEPVNNLILGPGLGQFKYSYEEKPDGSQNAL